MLQDYGIELGRYLLVDKISAAVNKFCSEERSENMRKLARFIED